MQTEGRNPRSKDIDRRSTLEILEIINAEDATVPGAVASVLPEIARAVDAVVASIRAGGRLIYAGAGTSGRLAVLDAVECVPTYNTPPEQVVALVAGGQAALTESVEGAEDDIDAGRADLRALNPTRNDTVIGVAASGRTPYVIGVLETALAAGATTGAVSCNVPAPILGLAKIRIGVPVGAEVVTGSTRMKAGTAQKLVLNMLSTAAMIRLGKVYENLMVDVRVSNIKLAARARRIIMEVTGVDDERAADLLAQANNEVKTAIVIALLGVTPENARVLIENQQGVLRRVISNED
jgi:N-acetylmuramic acid 6-phosphate etherase